MELPDGVPTYSPPDPPYRRSRRGLWIALFIIFITFVAIISPLIAIVYFIGRFNPAFLAAVLGVLSSIVGIITAFVFFISKKRKSTRELSWSIISDIPILSFKDQLTGHVQILFDDKPISDARLLVIKLWNSGRTPILSRDYEEPVSFSFGEEAKIVSAEIINTEPEALTVSFITDAENVIIGPLLLNNKDSITFKILLAGHDVDVNANARIAGLSELSFKKGEMSTKAL